MKNSTFVAVVAILIVAFDIASFWYPAVSPLRLVTPAMYDLDQSLRSEP